MFAEKEIRSNILIYTLSSLIYVFCLYTPYTVEITELDSQKVK